MEKKITILSPFFEEPTTGFHIRELARRLGINHTTIRQYLARLICEGLLTKERGKVYDAYKAMMSEAFLNLKGYYNREKIRRSGLLRVLEEQLEMPTIVLFGSYAYAEDDTSSDADLCLITNTRREVDVSEQERIINRPISLHRFSRSGWKHLMKKNPQLVNNICNGIVLSGRLQVLDEV